MSKGARIAGALFALFKGYTGGNEHSEAYSLLLSLFVFLSETANTECEPCSRTELREARQREETSAAFAHN